MRIFNLTVCKSGGGEEINQLVLVFQLSVEMNTHLPEQVIVQRYCNSDLSSLKKQPKKVFSSDYVCVVCGYIYL